MVQKVAGFQREATGHALIRNKAAQELLHVQIVLKTLSHITNPIPNNQKCIEREKDIGMVRGRESKLQLRKGCLN